MKRIFCCKCIRNIVQCTIQKFPKKPNYSRYEITNATTSIFVAFADAHMFQKKH